MRNVSRREFLGTAAWAAASAVCPGFGLAATAKPRLGRPAVQLYSLTAYIGGKRDPKTRQFDMSGVGLARALADVKTIGYEGVEFAGYWGKSAKEIAQLLKDNGLEVCGTHVSRGNLSPDWIRKTLDFNLEYGNTHVICPGSGMWPDAKWDKGNDAWWKQIVEFYAQAAETAKGYGCTIGYHNHTDEFSKKMALSDGTLMWDYFFSNTPANVCMEQDVGWTTCAGYDPCVWFKKFPGRSPTLHAKENGGYVDAEGKRCTVRNFDGVLGRPGKKDDGTPLKPVDWDRLFPVTDAAGVKWYVVECERQNNRLDAVRDSYAFLKSKGRCQG